MTAVNAGRFLYERQQSKFKVKEISNLQVTRVESQESRFITSKSTTTV
jgi:hypothetical protein